MVEEERVRLVEVALTYQTVPDPGDSSFSQFVVRFFLRDGELVSAVDIATGEGPIEAVDIEFLELIVGIVGSIRGRFRADEFGESVEGP